MWGVGWKWGTTLWKEAHQWVWGDVWGTCETPPNHTCETPPNRTCDTPLPHMWDPPPPHTWSCLITLWHGASLSTGFVFWDAFISIALSSTYHLSLLQSTWWSLPSIPLSLGVTQYSIKDIMLEDTKFNDISCTSVFNKYRRIVTGCNMSTNNNTGLVMTVWLYWPIEVNLCPTVRVTGTKRWPIIRQKLLLHPHVDLEDKTRANQAHPFGAWPLPFSAQTLCEKQGSHFPRSYHLAPFTFAYTHSTTLQTTTQFN